MRNKIQIQKECEWCGKNFIAYKISTRFCCKQCNDRAYKEKLRNNKISKCQKEIAEKEQVQISSKEYLSPNEVAKLLGVDKLTVYRYLWDGLLNSLQLRGKTFIRKKDIEKLFDDSRPYQKRHQKVNAPITEFYTTTEIKDKFQVSESWIFKVGKEKSIPRIFRMGKTYWSKKHFDNYFAKKVPSEKITEWYSVDDIKRHFNMTTTAVYSFVSKYAIPKKKVKREVFYSRKHVDVAKGIAKEEILYYTIKEAMAKFKVSRDQLYHYVQKHKVPKVKEGKYVKLARKELDEIFELSIIE